MNHYFAIIRTILTDTIIADLLSRQTLRLAGMKNNLFNFDHSTTSQAKFSHHYSYTVSVLTDFKSSSDNKVQQINELLIS